jgi:hypothetical protein
MRAGIGPAGEGIAIGCTFSSSGGSGLLTNGPARKTRAPRPVKPFRKVDGRLPERL